MTLIGRALRMTAVFLFAGVLLGVMAPDIGYADDSKKVISGIVKYASEKAITVKNRFSNATTVHDITGALVVDMNEKAISEIGSALHGNRAEIVYRNGKVVFVKIFPLIPE